MPASHDSSPTLTGTGREHCLSPATVMRSRANSVDCEDDNQTSISGSGDIYSSKCTPSERGNMHTGRGLSSEKEGRLDDDEALKPSPGTERDFVVEDNPFAFSPGQMNKLLNPKSLSAFHAVGGLAGLERGLRTSRHSGLSRDETVLEGYVSLEEAKAASRGTGARKAPLPKAVFVRTMTSSSRTSSEKPFADRKRVFKDSYLPAKKPKNIFQIMWASYNDKVLILLTVAAILSLAIGLYQTFGTATNPPVEWIEGVAIIVAIVIIVVVGSINDYQKERQFAKLYKKKQDRNVKVIRSGKSQEISIFDVLVGDVVHIEPGDVIPADGVFIDGYNVKCDESSATGESYLSHKHPADDVFQAIEGQEASSKMDPFLISGAKVAEGVGTFLVTATGVNSSHGKVLMALDEEPEATPLQNRLNKLAEYIAKFGGAAALLLFIVLFIEFLVRLPHSSNTPAMKGQNFVNILIITLTVVVIAVPEGLPLAVTLALAYATTRMLKDNNLVRRLRACEIMGNATDVCSDKTGTLTQNKMTVVMGIVGISSRFVDRKWHSSRIESSSSNEAEDKDSASMGEFFRGLPNDVKALITQSIVINSTAFESESKDQQRFIGSKTETALLTFAQDYMGIGPTSIERSHARVVYLLPFDSTRKYMATVVRLDNGKYRLFVKGAAEILLRNCTRVLHDPTQGISDTELNAENAEFLNGMIAKYASRSLRTIGLFYRDFEKWPSSDIQTTEEAEIVPEDFIKDLIFLGIFGIQDPLRDGVQKAVQACQGAGVIVRMVTGDNVSTAKAIAKECGILSEDGLVIEGPDFRKLNMSEMDNIIPHLRVLARSSPTDKKMLVKRLKELGHIVAVTGDGTNDAAALKTANIGFSMGISGTEVAKEASDIILMDDDFSSIVKAIMWGRAVNDAVKKFLQA
jgi:P-type Ca2+ transporter type 2C